MLGDKDISGIIGNSEGVSSVGANSHGCSSCPNTVELILNKFNTGTALITGNCIDNHIAVSPIGHILTQGNRRIDFVDIDDSDILFGNISGVINNSVCMIAGAGNHMGKVKCKDTCLFFGTQSHPFAVEEVLELVQTGADRIGCRIKSIFGSYNDAHILIVPS